MKADKVYAALVALHEQGMDLDQVDIEVFDFASGESIEVTDLGLTGDNVFQLKFDYGEG